jgi:hypothetical protein
MDRKGISVNKRVVDKFFLILILCFLSACIPMVDDKDKSHMVFQDFTDDKFKNFGNNPTDKPEVNERPGSDSLRSLCAGQNFIDFNTLVKPTISNTCIGCHSASNIFKLDSTDDNIVCKNTLAYIDLDEPSNSKFIQKPRYGLPFHSGGSNLYSELVESSILTWINNSDSNLVLPEINFSISNSEFNEASNEIDLTVTLSKATTEEVSISITLGGTATVNIDFQNIQTINVPAGETTFTSRVSILDDDEEELDEIITFQLTDPSQNIVLGNNIIHTTKIIDDDIEDVIEPPVAKINFAMSEQVVLENSNFTSVEISLDKPSADIVTFDIIISGDGGLFIPVQNLKFRAGTTSISYIVIIRDNNLVDRPRINRFTLSNIVNASIGSRSVKTIVIQDND